MDETEYTFRMERIDQLWNKIHEKFDEQLTPKLWIENIHDHKGCIQVTWSVKPTKKMVKTIDKIWTNDFNEGETEHIFEEKRIYY